MSLQISVLRQSNELSREDAEFLKKLGERRLTLDECISEANADSKDTLNLIRRLIRTGHLCLVISVYSWGTEFEIIQAKKEHLAQVQVK